MPIAFNPNNPGPMTSFSIAGVLPASGFLAQLPQLLVPSVSMVPWSPVGFPPGPKPGILSQDLAEMGAFGPVTTVDPDESSGIAVHYKVQRNSPQPPSGPFGL